MEKSDSEQPLLHHEDSDWPRLPRAWLKRPYNLPLLLIVLGLVLSNSALLYLVSSRDQASSQEASKFAGLAYNKPTPYNIWTDFQDPDLRNSNWRGMDLTPVKVLLSDKEAIEYGLSISLNRFPWDPTQGIYITRVFHGLHCLKFIQFAFEQKHTNEYDGHVYHCLDSLRQDLSCYADDTPMPVTELPDVLAAGEIRICRDLDALIRWTQEPNRFPCYNRTMDDPTKPEQQIEAYSFCNEDSPYFEAQEAYFAKWGKHSS